MLRSEAIARRRVLSYDLDKRVDALPLLNKEDGYGYSPIRFLQSSENSAEVHVYNRYLYSLYKGIPLPPPFEYPNIVCRCLGVDTSHVSLIPSLSFNDDSVKFEYLDSDIMYDGEFDIDAVLTLLFTATSYVSQADWNKLRLTIPSLRIEMYSKHI